MTEFISRNHGHSCYEIIIKTTNHEHYKATEDFARRLIDHAKPVPDNNVSCKWIPVTERLPEDGKKVLVFHNVKQVKKNRRTLKTIVVETSGVISIGVVTLCNNGEKFQNLWFTYDDYGRGIWIADTGEHVTHWMPFPESPKEDNQ